MMKKMPFTIDELITYLEGYQKTNRFKRVDGDARYAFKVGGSHYVVDHMRLSKEEKLKLKGALSLRYCLEQALATERIPAIYLPQVLEEVRKGLPDELKNDRYLTAEIDRYIRLAKIASEGRESRPPSPFNQKDGQFIMVRQQVIRTLLQYAINLTGVVIKPILDKDGLLEIFNYGGEAVIKYLEEHPTKMGPARQ